MSCISENDAPTRTTAAIRGRTRRANANAPAIISDSITGAIATADSRANDGSSRRCLAMLDSGRLAPPAASIADIPRLPPVSASCISRRTFGQDIATHASRANRRPPPAQDKRAVISLNPSPISSKDGARLDRQDKRQDVVHSVRQAGGNHCRSARAPGGEQIDAREDQTDQRRPEDCRTAQRQMRQCKRQGHRCEANRDRRPAPQNRERKRLE